MNIASELKKIEQLIKDDKTSKKYKKLCLLIKNIQDSVNQTRECKHQFLATLYCHCCKLFANTDFEVGCKRYLAVLFPDKKLQYNRNKYLRALKLLHAQKVVREDDVLAKIKQIGLQALFNGKRSKKTSSTRKPSLASSLKRLMKYNSLSDIIISSFIMQAPEATDETADFVILCTKGKIKYSMSKKDIKSLKKSTTLIKLEKSKR